MYNDLNKRYIMLNKNKQKITKCNYHKALITKNEYISPLKQKKQSGADYDDGNDHILRTHTKQGAKRRPKENKTRNIVFDNYKE